MQISITTNHVRRFFRRMKWLSRSEQEALRTVLNDLVFLRPYDGPITRDALPHLAKKINNDFVELCIKRREDWGFRMPQISSLSIVNNDEVATAQVPTLRDKVSNTFLDQGSFMLPEHRDRIPLKEYLDGIHCVRNIEFNMATDHYHHLGFTPKLATLDPEKIFATNCAGSAFLCGAFVRLRKGTKASLMITPDHPVVVVHTNEGMISLDHRPEPMKGYLEDRGSYKIYRSNRQDEMPSLVSFMVDYDRGLLYEILEGIEVLRQVSLGGHKNFLPKSKDAYVQVAGAHMEILQAANWKKVQSILFPDIAFVFDHHAAEWSHEISRMYKKRTYWHSIEVLWRMFREAHKGTSLKDESFDDIKKKFFEELKRYRVEIDSFMERDCLFAESTPSDVIIFVSSTKKQLETMQDTDLSKRCKIAFLDIVFDRKTQL